jgi:acetolactate synthase-1/2/3 large subunit/sulfoacetaldehyde acetyltransferase
MSPDAYRPTHTRALGDSEAVQAAARLLANAERPLLLVGGGVVDSGASDEAVALAELMDMAMVPSYGHNDAVPNSHAHFVGSPGGRGSGEAHQAMNRADVILALGTRMSQASTNWDYSILRPETKIIQIDIDAMEIGRNYPVAAGIVGDAKAVAGQLLYLLRREIPEGRALPEWKSEFQGLAESRRQRLAAEANIAESPMMPQEVYVQLNKALPKDCMVTIDAGVAPGLSYDRLSFESPRSMFNYAGQGALGMGYTVGLGTKLGRPDRPALSIQGDGGFLYSSQEINTAVRNNIPLVSLVLNNNCMGAEKAQQKRLHNERYVGVDLVNPRFDHLAEVYGAKGYYVEHADQIADAVTEAFSLQRPCVIEIPVQEYFPPSAPVPGKR